jgi:FkbM family methyltransferase
VTSALTSPTGRSIVERGQRATRRLPGKWGRRVRETAKWTVDYGGARGTGRRAWAFARARGRTGLLLAPFGDGQMLVDTTDEEIGRVVYVRGDYERAYMGTALDLLRREAGFDPAGRTMIDVGANIGTTTIDALLHFGFARTISFEPDARNVRLLRMNLLLNDLQDRSAVHAAAVSDRDGELHLQQQDGNFGDSRVSTDATSDGQAVPCLRLDTLVGDGSIDLDALGLVWMDAQGHDPRVLAGASTITGAGIPIVVEYWPDGLGTGEELALLEDIVGSRYSRFVDLRELTAGRPAIFDTSAVTMLRTRYGPAQHTDLLLLR